MIHPIKLAMCSKVYHAHNKLLCSALLSFLLPAHWRHIGFVASRTTRHAMTRHDTTQQASTLSGHCWRPRQQAWIASQHAKLLCALLSACCCTRTFCKSVCVVQTMWHTRTHSSPHTPLRVVWGPCRRMPVCQRVCALCCSEPRGPHTDIQLDGTKELQGRCFVRRPPLLFFVWAFTAAIMHKRF